MYTRAFNNIFAELMVNAIEAFVDTFIHDSEKNLHQSIFQIFLNTVQKTILYLLFAVV